jgi:hypothetical protein
MEGPAEKRSARVLRLSEAIRERNVRELFERFVETVLDLHEDVGFQATGTEARFYCRNTLLFRVVPYRELFHVLIGEPAAWETRVRTHTAMADTLDRVLERFLQTQAAAAG